MKMCQKHRIHLVSDEIYAISVWHADRNSADEPNIEPFTSALTLASSDSRIIDPSLVHVEWGISKDFGANGLRLGSIISQHNPSVHAAMVPVAKYSYASSLTEAIVIKLLSDSDFVDSYISENNKKFFDNYKHVAKWADEQGIDYEKGVNAAFFLWVDLGVYFRRQRRLNTAASEFSLTSDITRTVNDALIREKIFLASGSTFGSEIPGMVPHRIQSV